MGNQNKRVVFVLPTYKEEANIQNTIQKIYNQPINGDDYAFHILVVDDNSPDNTQSIVKSLMEQNENIHLLTGPKIGLGNAYKRGFQYAIQALNSDIVFQIYYILFHL